MQYDNYQRKINKIVNVLRKIHSKSRLIIIVLSIIAVTAMAYFVSKGTIYAESNCPDRVPYGDPVGYNAKSFLSSIRYEFYDYEKSEWTFDTDLTPGRYKVRGVSKRSFGRYGYTEEYEFSVIPRKISINVADSAQYGDNPEIYADTAFEDRVICTSFIYSNEKSLSTNVSADINSLYIVNERGEDVTDNYIIDTPTSVLNILPRQVTLEVSGCEKIYDGTPLYSRNYVITQGNIVDGDELSVAFERHLTNVGSVANSPTVNVFDSHQKDISYLYNFTLHIGTLSVIPKPLSVSTGSLKAEYDGKEHFNDDITLTELVDGHIYATSLVTIATNAGTYTNEIKINIFDCNSNDVTPNYNISYEYGTLEITKRPLLVTTYDINRTYTGYPIEGDIYDAQGLIDGHVFYAVPSMLTEVGSIINELSDIRVWNVDNTTLASSYVPADLSDNYEITTNYGTLTVLPKPVKIFAAHEYKVYKGSPWTPSTKPEAQGLVLGHFISDFISVGSQTDVGSSEINIEPGSIRIKDETQKDVTQNYIIELLPSTLTVEKREIWLESASASKTYD